MVTRAMKAQLKDKGYPDSKVREMSPEVAWRILNPPPKVDPEMEKIKDEIKMARRMEKI